MLLSLTDAAESRYIGNPPEPKRESRAGNTRLDVPVRAVRAVTPCSRGRGSRKPCRRRVILTGPARLGKIEEFARVYCPARSLPETPSLSRAVWKHLLSAVWRHPLSVKRVHSRCRTAAVRPCMSTGWAWAIPLPLGVPIAADLRACDAPTIAASCGSREAALGTKERKVPVASLLSAPDSLYVSVQIAGKSSSAFSAGLSGDG